MPSGGQLPGIEWNASSTMSLTNLDTQETKYMVYNPTDLDVVMSTNWTKHEVVGLSFTPLQYVGTSNIEVGFTLRFLPETLKEFDEYVDTVKFLEALLYPPEEGESAPDVLLTWPGFITLICKVNSLGLKPQHFNASGYPTIMETPMKFEHVRKVRLLQSDIRDRGLQQFRA